MGKILFVKVISRNVVVFTEDELREDSLTNQLEYILERYGFARLNPNTIVNIEAVKSYDSKLRIAYMDGEEDSKIQVSRINRHKVPLRLHKK